MNNGMQNNTKLNSYYFTFHRPFSFIPPYNPRRKKIIRRISYRRLISYLITWQRYRLLTFVLDSKIKPGSPSYYVGRLRITFQMCDNLKVVVVVRWWQSPQTKYNTLQCAIAYTDDRFDNGILSKYLHIYVYLREHSLIIYYVSQNK